MSGRPRPGGPGRFITVEGIEGVGKTTQARVIAEQLRASGCTVVETREPGGTPLGEAIRALLLRRAEASMGPDTELLLMFAARAEHLRKLIRPALAAGRWVISDRFTDASYAYQGGGRKEPWACIEMLEDYIQGSLRPDLTLLLDVPVGTARDRLGSRGKRTDRFESEGPEFFEAVRRAYLERARAEPDRIRLIDADAPIGEVTERIRPHVQALLG